MRTSRSLRWGGAAALVAAFLVCGTLTQPRQAEADTPGPITTRVMNILQGALANGGTAGMFVKEVGGAEIAAQNEDTAIGPASAIKVLIHLYTIDQVEQGNAAFGDDVAVWQLGAGTTCPNVATMSTEDLDTATAAMMRVSSNTSTRGLQDHWTTATLNAYATSLGLAQTSLSGNNLGCDAGATPPIDGNSTTLAELGAIYEAVADSSELTGAFRQTFYNLMSGREQAESFGGDFTGIWNELVTMVDEEMPPGMPQTLKDSFLAGMTANHKGGSYLRCSGMAPCQIATEWLTWAGWAEFPVCEGGAAGVKQYVWGAYLQDVVDNAYSGTGSTSSGLVFLDVRAEPLREQLHDALESWGDCFPHWEVIAKVGGGNVLNPALPDYVPGTWVNKNVTLYLRCVPGDAPIKYFRGDKSITFNKDGEFFYEPRPQDECIDVNGAVAPPLAVPYGPIRIDKTAPVCSFTPSTIFVARNTVEHVVFTTVFSPDISGPAFSSATSVTAGGASVANIVTNGSPATSIEADVTMGSSTAGRVELVVTLVDNAGNSSTCKGIVRAK
jgi:hypothetical protein